MGFSRLPYEAEVDSLSPEKRLQLVAKSVPAEPADQRDLRAKFCGRHRLVRALAAGEIMHCLARNGFADARMPRGGCHHVHVDAAGNEDAAHT